MFVRIRKDGGTFWRHAFSRTFPRQRDDQPRHAKVLLKKYYNTTTLNYLPTTHPLVQYVCSHFECLEKQLKVFVSTPLPPLFGFSFFFSSICGVLLWEARLAFAKKMNTRFLKMLRACEESLCKRKGAFPRSCRRNKTVYFDDDGK